MESDRDKMHRDYTYMYFYRRNIPPEHPMCRSDIRVRVFMPYASKSLVAEYIRECRNIPIWIN